MLNAIIYQKLFTIVPHQISTNQLCFLAKWSFSLFISRFARY